jgi:hypothetical protein
MKSPFKRTWWTYQPWFLGHHLLKMGYKKREICTWIRDDREEEEEKFWENIGRAAKRIMGTLHLSSFLVQLYSAFHSEQHLRFCKYFGSVR